MEFRYFRSSDMELVIRSRGKMKYFATFSLIITVTFHARVLCNEVVLTEGSIASLPCHVNVENAFLVAWYNGTEETQDTLIIMLNDEGQKSGPGYERGRFDIGDPFSLIINQITKSNEGRYLCDVYEIKAHNLFTNYTDVTVVDKPYFCIEGCKCRSDCNLTVPADSQHVLLQCSIIGTKGNIFLYWTGDGSEDRILNSTTAHSDAPANFSVYLRKDIRGFREEVTCSLNATAQYDSLRANSVLRIQNMYHEQISTTPTPDFSKGNIPWIALCVPIIVITLYFIVKLTRRKVDLLQRVDSIDSDLENQPMSPVTGGNDRIIENDDSVENQITAGSGAHQCVMSESGEKKRQSWRYDDPIHGSILMPPYCQMIIDTPEFQRLKNIKQLGCTSYVYENAVHTRFEHSLGVSHLAGRLIDHLQQDRSNGVTDVDVTCVRIAGLCHDLGHGPFSHVFKRLIEEYSGGKWKTAEVSGKIFKYLIEKNNLMDELNQLGVGDNSIEFICDLILGGSENPIADDKFFMYQIVNNRVNGVDVDRLDYIMRDAHCVGMRRPDIDSILTHTKAHKVRGSCRKELCFSEKVADNVSTLFNERRDLYRTIYKHAERCIIESMIIDVLREGSQGLIYTAGDGRKVSLIDAVKDPGVFCQLDDRIKDSIEKSCSSDEGIEKAQKIITRIENRELYQCIVKIENAEEKLATLQKVKIEEWIEKNLDNEGEIWKRENVKVEVFHLDFGHQKRNPFLFIPFFGESDDGAIQDCYYISNEQIPSSLHDDFYCATLRIFTKLAKESHLITKKDKTIFFEKAKTTGLWNESDRSTSPTNRAIDKPPMITTPPTKRATVTVKRSDDEDEKPESQELLSSLQSVRRQLSPPNEP